MRNTIAVTLFSVSLSAPFAVCAQGTSGMHGSGAAGVEKQTESTNPSALSGSAGTKQAPNDDTKSSPSKAGTPVERATPTNPVSEAGPASNRSSSGSSTNTSPAEVPSATGKTSESVKVNPPSSDTPTRGTGTAPR